MTGGIALRPEKPICRVILPTSKFFCYFSLIPFVKNNEWWKEMPIIKIQKRKNPYVILDKTFITDKHLSLKARGLLAYLLSLPESWEIHIRELSRHFPDGKHAISTALKELRQNRYVVHQRYRDSSGVYRGGDYHVFEVPQPPPENQDVVNPPQPKNQAVAASPPQPDFPVVENPVVENPLLENQALLNNNNSNNTQNKKITAAIESPHPTALSNPSSVAAVPLKMVGEEEGRIGVVLTERQCALARQVANRLAQHHPSGNAQRLFQEIELTLLDSKSFTKAEQDFNKKLNTIRKVIREGKWSPPVLMQQKQQQQFNQLLAELEQQLRELNGDRRHLREMLSALDKETQNKERNALHQQLIRCEKAIATFEREKKHVQEHHDV